MKAYQEALSNEFELRQNDKIENYSNVHDSLVRVAGI
jgi:hypothetical protein